MKKNIFEHTMRWYGPSDAVSLLDIRQAGATGIVTALHHIPNGEVWPLEEILKRQKEVSDANLTWSVVESLPVHEDVKLNAAGSEKIIENYKESLRNLGKAGIKTVTYNFMPILDWTRTRLYHKLPDETLALYFDIVDLAAFDLFILEREGAAADYSQEIISKAGDLYQKMNDEAKRILQRNILAGLPGSEEGYELDEFKKKLSLYDGITKQDLKNNMVAFLTEVTPVAEEWGINLAIHPDDPPFEIFGIPRFVSNRDDLRFLMDNVPSNNNGICFCTGSFGANPENDLVEMVKEFKDRIHFLHLRSVEVVDDRHFYEADHLEGNADFVSIIRAFYGQDRQVPMRPDHGHAMMDDLKKQTNPGYTCIGRMKGLRALMGIERTIVELNNT
ncbi:mannonate dehydratase [Membranihabitans maritimus]|uniref:mannonate dehydratase n=1 Tax=Membranihabitans maritimus TaxID=2904244 RepID=UPI001F022C2F|nr:mannonate dehydratase [Membranihabitans maritimus]